MKFNERLKKLRTERNLTHEDMAHLLGMQRQSYAYLESKEEDKKVDMILKLASHFNVSTDYLLGASDFPRPYTNDEQAFLDTIIDEDLKEWFAKEVNHLDKEDLKKLKILWNLINK